MFIGHYAAAPMAAATGQIKLWHGFVAVQFVDYIWAGLTLAGIEKARIVDGFTQANPMDLHFMPFSHSLFYTAIWALFAAVVFRVFQRSRNAGGAILIAVLVLSHWLGDFIVHAPDMTLYPGGEKYGLGLWQNVWISLPLEIGIVLLGLWVYVRVTVPASGNSRMWTALFALFLVALQVINTFGPVPGSIKEIALMAMVAFTVIAIAAGLYERTRHLYFERVDDLHEPN